MGEKLRRGNNRLHKRAPEVLLKKAQESFIKA